MIVRKKTFVSPVCSGRLHNLHTHVLRLPHARTAATVSLNTSCARPSSHETRDGHVFTPYRETQRLANEGVSLSRFERSGQTPENLLCGVSLFSHIPTSLTQAKAKGWQPARRPLGRPSTATSAPRRAATCVFQGNGNATGLFRAGESSGHVVAAVTVKAKVRRLL